jgi:hypothetical protein
MPQAVVLNNDLLNQAQLSNLKSKFEQAVYNQDSSLAITLQVEKDRKGMNLEYSQEALKRIESKFRENIDLPKGFQLVGHEFTLSRDGGSTSNKLDFYNKETGKVLSFVTFQDKSLSSPNNGEVKTNLTQKNPKDYIENFRLMNQIAAALVGESLTDNSNFERVKGQSNTTFNFTNKDSAKVATVVFNNLNGLATVSESNLQKTENINQLPEQDFRDAVRRDLSPESVKNLSIFATKDQAGKFLLSESGVDAAKDQLAKAFNIPEKYQINLNVSDTGSAIFQNQGVRFLGGNISYNNQSVDFLFIIDKASFALGSQENVSRSNVPQAIEQELSKARKN